MYCLSGYYSFSYLFIYYLFIWSFIYYYLFIYNHTQTTKKSDCYFNTILDIPRMATYSKLVTKSTQ
jgi:hypothetical protein